MPCLTVSNKKAGAISAPACRVVWIVAELLRYSIRPTGNRFLIISVVEIIMPVVVVVVPEPFVNMSELYRPKTANATDCRINGYGLPKRRF